MANDQRLERLLATYEHAVHTLRAAIALLNNGAPVTFPLPKSVNGNGHGGDRRSSLVQKQAARLDTQRADAIARADAPTKKHNRKWPLAAQIRKQRAFSARFLDQFDRTDPKQSKDVKGHRRAVGALLRRGYLVKKGGGYVRTDKHFSIDPNA